MQKKAKRPYTFEQPKKVSYEEMMRNIIPNYNKLDQELRDKAIYVQAQLCAPSYTPPFPPSFYNGSGFPCEYS